MKSKRIVLSLLSLASFAIMNITTVVHAEDLKTQASVNVARDPNGGLTLESVSPNISFGTVKLDTTKKSVTKQADADFAASILDSRGTGEGWTLQVGYDPSTKDKNWQATDSEGVLKGAELTIDPAKSDLTHDESADFENGPTKQGLVNVSDDASNVYTADVGNGLGEWTSTFASAKAGINLSVPSISIAGKYQATLDWTLLNAPNN